MVIEIRNVGFQNKGAELMLRAITQQIRMRISGAIIATIPDPRDSYEQRAELGLYQKLWLQRYRLQWSRLAAMVSRKNRLAHGMVLDSEVDVVLDASGFAYSSDLDLRSLNDAARLARHWKKQGTRVILLPQSLGPFKGFRARRALRTLVDHCDLIFARDKISHDHVVATAGIRETIRLAPDFTNLLEGESPKSFIGRGAFCLIPNARMLDKTPRNVGGQYLECLADCIRYLREKGLNPFILIHEKRRDLEIARALEKMLDRPIDIIEEDDALKIKGIIGASEGVISSRFHGIVSGLSQGVPTLGTGWSHKYRTLFEDYGFPEGLLDLPIEKTTLRARLALLTDSSHRHRIRQSLLRASRRQKTDTKAMWDEVFAVMRLAARARDPAPESIQDRQE